MLSDGWQIINLRIVAPPTLFNFLWKDIGLIWATERWHCRMNGFFCLTLIRNHSNNRHEERFGDSRLRSVLICLRAEYYYTNNGTVLENVTTMRDLRVILDQKLPFQDHVNAAVSKPNQDFGLLMRSLQSPSRRCNISKLYALAAFNANVRPILEYCSVIWAGGLKPILFASREFSIDSWCG